MTTCQHARGGARSRRRLRPAALLAIAGLLLTGCSLLGTDGGPTTAPPDPTTEQATPREGSLLPSGTTEVEVPVGEIVQVALPDGSLGVGDDWEVVSVSDPAIAEATIAIGENVFGVEPGADKPGMVGGTQQFAVEIEGLEPGETTLRVLYCTRTRDFSEDCDQSQGTLTAPVEPVEIEVSVG